MKRDYRNGTIMLLALAITSVFYLHFSYAGSFINISGKKYYKTEDGRIATSSWIWIDSDNDNIAECYRFSSDGTIAINYTHYDGKKTNELGQYIEDNVVIKKMVSSGKIITEKDEIYGPFVEKSNDKYILKNVLIPDSMSVNGKRKIEAGFFWGQDSIGNVDSIDGEIINDVKKKYDPFSDIEAESGVIYSPDAKDNGITILRDGEGFVPGFDAEKYITASKRFEKDIEEVIIYNGDKWTHCMVLNGNNSSVKFTFDKYNYMCFEYSNENHINIDKETNDQYTDAILSIYVDGKLYEEISDFTNSEPDIEEIDFDNDKKKTVELKLTIKSGNKSERVYLRNVKLRKIKDE